MERGRRSLVGSVALAFAVVQAATSGMAVAQTGAAVTRPPQAECAAVRDVDLDQLAREAAESEANRNARIAAGELPSREDFLRDVQIPDWAERRPSDTAPIIIRARMGPGGGHSTDYRVVVWREADGVWWFWKHVLGGPPAPPPPPRPPGAQPGSPEWDAWLETQPPADLPQEFRSWPAREGRVDPDQAAVLEAAWADPCRAWDPVRWPHDIPLNRRIDGSRRQLCPQDSSGQAAEIIEHGVARRVSAACINGTPTYRLMSRAIYVTGAED